jgi:hypothetical protein
MKGEVASRPAEGKQPNPQVEEALLFRPEGSDSGKAAVTMCVERSQFCRARVSKICQYFGEPVGMGMLAGMR